MDKNQLENLTIFEIREVARRAGIIPGTRRKSEIIEDIVKVSEGKILPNTDKKQGRPAKTLGYIDIFKPKTEDVHTLVLNQDSSRFTPSEELEVEGYLDITNGQFLLWINVDGSFKSIFVPAQLIDKEVFRKGDKLFVKITTTPAGGLVNDVMKINGVKTSQLPIRCNYEEVVHHPSNKKIANTNLNLTVGETYFVEGADNRANTCAAVNFLNSCKSDCKIYVNTTLAENNKYIVSALDGDVEKFTSYITENNTITNVVLNLALERAKRVLETEKHCIVVIDDLNSLLGANPENMQTAKELLNLAKNTEKGSVTLLVVSTQNRYTLGFYKLASGVFKVREGILVEE